MRKFILPLLVLGAALLPAQSVETIPFRAALAARNETTPVVDATATGGVTVWLHVVKDAAGNVTSGSLDFAVNYRFAGATSLTAMHIHKAVAGLAGAIVVPVPLTRIDDTTGTGTISNRQVQFTSADRSIADAVTGLLANPSDYYFNIHTSDAPGGAMRGQLQRAEMTVLMGLMSPANENPPIAGLAASGVATVVALRTLNPDFSISSASVIFDVNYTGFLDGTTFQGFHIHFGNQGINGPVTIDSGLSAQNTVTAAGGGSGNLHYEFEVNLTRNLATDTVYQLFNQPQGTYINLHTSVNPGGAIRAQLHRTDKAEFQVTLNTAEEVPTNAVAASAPGMVRVYTLRNADGSIPAGAVIFDVNPRVPASTSITAMHIHDALAGVNGGVTIDSRLTSQPLLNDVTLGAGNIMRLATVSTAAALSSLNSLVQNPEKHYVNMHTTANPGGVVRAQLGAAALPAPAVSTAISAVYDGTRTTAANSALMSIYGQRLSKVTSNLDGFLQLDTLPRTLNGTSVTVGGVAAPLVLVSPGQLIVQVPADATAGTLPVVVTSTSGVSSAYQMKVQASSPNIFFDNVGGIITKQDFSVIRPSNPAVAGDLLAIFSTGNGQTTPALATGAVPPLTSLFNAPTATVTIGGRDAAVVYSVAAPGFPGLYQTGVRMPAGVPAGNAAVVMTVGGTASNSVQISVR